MDYVEAMIQLKELDIDEIVDILQPTAAELVEALEDYIVDWAEDRDEL